MIGKWKIFLYFMLFCVHYTLKFYCDKYSFFFSMHRVDRIVYKFFTMKLKINAIYLSQQFELILFEAIKKSDPLYIDINQFLHSIFVVVAVVVYKEK